MMLEIEYNPAKREFYIMLWKKIHKHRFQVEKVREILYYLDGFDSGLKDGGGESSFNGVR
jgi:hypothetical protein